MSTQRNSPARNPAAEQAPLSQRLPPRILASESPEEALAKKQAREHKDAQVRGVASIHDMRLAIKRVGRDLPALSEVPRLGRLDAAAFRARRTRPALPDRRGGRPLAAGRADAAHAARRYSHLPVRARVGDYINTAFAPDRAMQDMSMLAYLDLVAAGTHDLPPYLGNLELRELNSLCHWPAYFGKMGPPRFWLGPAGTVTPLHCDYDDNIFAQIWGSKRIFLAPPHHDAFLYPK